MQAIWLFLCAGGAFFTSLLWSQFLSKNRINAAELPEEARNPQGQNAAFALGLLLLGRSSLQIAFAIYTVLGILWVLVPDARTFLLQHADLTFGAPPALGFAAGQFEKPGTFAQLLGLCVIGIVGYAVYVGLGETGFTKGVEQWLKGVSTQLRS
jgi:hypothetical protein